MLISAPSTAATDCADHRHPDSIIPYFSLRIR
jgi:hypothetical protein